jgi:hypothetical protein
MTIFQYNYVQSSGINGARLESEIRAASGVVTALDYLDVRNDINADIYMKAELSDAEELVLEDLVAQHVNIPLPGDPLPKIATEDNITLVRQQTSPLNWSFQLYGIILETSTPSGACRHLVDGITRDHVTTRFFDGDGTELFSEADITTKTCRTLVEWMPPWDYYVWGGVFHQKVSPTDGITINVQAVPDYPKAFGGSIDFISSTDLSFIGPDAGLDVGAETTQLLQYNGGVGTNKLGFSFHHSSGLQHDMYIGLKIYKERST